MFQGADYLFAIQTKDFKFWKIRDNKVTVNAQPYFLDYAPAGREDITVLNQRNMKYWCIDRSVATGLNFVNDGAQILKYILLNKGIEEQVYLSVLEQQLYYEPLPNATLAFTAGQTPFTPNDTTTGTITGTPGDTVMVRMMLNNPDPPDDNITGNFDVVNFVHTGLAPGGGYLAEQVYTITIPGSGVINFSFFFTVSAGSSATGTLELLNINGSSEFGYGYWYKQRTRTEFDLTTYSHEGSGVKCATLEEGLAKFLKSNEGTTIELDDTEAINIKMDGIRLREKANYVDVDGVEFSSTALGGGATDGQTATIFLNNEGDHVGISLESQSQGFESGFPDNITSTNCLMHNIYNVPIELTIEGTSEFTCTRQPNTFSFRRRFLLNSSTIPTQNDYAYHTTGILTAANVYTQVYSVTITIPPGERLYTQSQFLGGGGGDPAIEFTTKSKFSISFISRYEATYVKALRAQYLFQKYIEFVGEGNFTAAVSDFFATHSDKVFTCGNWIRQIADGKFMWNFAGFFQFWDCFSSVGLIEEDGVIDLAQKQDLTDAAEIIELAEPSDLKVSIERELLYNELELGYPPVKNDIGVLNGNQEFNTQFLWSLGVMKKPARMDKLSRISASCYAIEKIRVTTINKDTTDYKADNDVFVVVINNTLIPASGDIPAHYELDRSLNASATGLIEPETVFNIALSPHLNMLRNGPWLRSSLWLCDHKILKYQSSDKNRSLEFDDPVYGHIEEDKDENVGGLGDRFITPLLFTITIPPPDDGVNPRAVYQFPFLGTTWTGISKKDSNGLASRKAQTWELLALPGNDFKKLEAYYG